MTVLGGLASSRLDNVLVREEQLAVSVTAYDLQFEDASFLQAQMDVKPGVDPAVAEKRLDEVITELVNEWPDVRRTAARGDALSLCADRRARGRR